jgi:hypothetical protein
MELTDEGGLPRVGPPEKEGDRVAANHFGKLTNSRDIQELSPPWL